MKVGDLVRWPSGMKHLCPTTYSLGVVVSVFHQCRRGEQAEVFWFGDMSSKDTFMTKRLVVVCEGG